MWNFLESSIHYEENSLCTTYFYRIHFHFNLFSNTKVTIEVNNNKRTNEKRRRRIGRIKKLEYAIEQRIACFWLRALFLSLSFEGYQFNRKKRVKDNSSFSASYHLQRLSVLPPSPTTTIGFAGRLSVWSNLGRVPGYLSRKYLQATVQKPNLVCGRLILSYYIPSVDSSRLDPLSPSLSTLFQAHFLFRLLLYFLLFLLHLFHFLPFLLLLFFVRS